MKCIVLLADGVADEPNAELNGKTPLESARLPNLDHMAARGILGLTRTIPPGMQPGNDVGLLSVLGYDPAAHPTAVAPLQAAGMELRLAPGDVAMRLALVGFDRQEAGAEVMREGARA